MRNLIKKLYGMNKNFYPKIIEEDLENFIIWGSYKEEILM